MPDITYRFVASGAQDIEKAYQGIEKAAVRHKAAVESASRATTRASSGGGAGGGRRGASETERLAQRVAAAQERQAQREVRAAERTATAKARIEERNRAYVARIRDRHFADEQRKEERHARDKARRLEQAAAESARKEEAARKRARSAAAGKRKQSIGVLKDLAGGAFLGAVGAGGALIGAAASEGLQLHEAAARIAISARGAGEEAKDPEKLRRSFEQTAIRTPGQSAAGVADAVAKFVSLTGKLDVAMENIGTFATISSATGADIGDVSEAAASLFQQFDIKGIEDMREALAALTFQGKNGAFELKDAAAQFQRLAASGAAFGIPRGVAGVKTLGGLTQIARTGTGSAEQAATAVENLLTNLKLKQTQLGAAGVKVFDKSGQARDVRDLIIESISKVGGKDMALKSKGLAQIFGEQGIRAINPLIAKYSETFRTTQGTDAEKTAAAVAKLRDEFTKAIDAPGTFADAEEDAALAQRQASAQLSAAWEALKAKTADALIPSLGKLAESLAGKESLLDPFIEAVGLAAEAVVWFAEATGFKKQKTKAEVLTDAEKALHKFDVGHMTASYTKEELAKRKELVAARNAAQADLWGGPPGTASKGPMSQEDFVNQYLAAGTGKQTRTAAELVAGRVASDSMLNNDWFMKNFGNETQAQQDIRRQYTVEQRAQQEGAGTVHVEDVQASLNAAAEAAKNAAAAMQKMASANQGNILGP